MTEATIFVRFNVPGFHHWPGATAGREYLGDKHRHLFNVEVRCKVSHDDREIEFHDLLDQCRIFFPGGDMGAKSCEMMARELGQKLTRLYGRVFEVSVSEDGECGSVVTVRPE